MPKKNIPNYRLHKASEQAFVELGGKRIYLGKHGSKASRLEYDRLIEIWLANGRKLPTIETMSEMTCQELAIKYLDWAKEYHSRQPKSFGHCQTAMRHLVKFFAKELVNNFKPASLLFLQEQLITVKNKKGKPAYARPSVNRYITLVKQAFDHGVLHGWIEGNTVYALKVVKNLKIGRTSAREYRKIKPVSDKIVNKTLPFLPSTIAAMAQVQRLAGMRPQEVRNMRLCDIDRTTYFESDGVWIYRPFTHKTAYRGKELVKPIGPQAQEILKPYIEEKINTPEAFIFSPRDSVLRSNSAKRRARKTLNKNGETQPSQRNRAKANPKRKPGEQYSIGSYVHAIEKSRGRKMDP